MFEEKTFEAILKDMLARAPADIDTREGSIFYDALAPAAAEMAQMYIRISTALDQVFADTADRQYLILRAAERGLHPKAAVKATAVWQFDRLVDKGVRFRRGESVFVCEKALDEEQFIYLMIAEEAGEAANHAVGEIVPLTPSVSALGKFLRLETPGEEEEETEEFRKRYFDSISGEAFGGNRKDYITKVKLLDGVGDVKAFRAPRGGGTVDIVFTTSEFQAPESALVQKVQQAIDPTDGKGDGIAPIGHRVTVRGAVYRPIAVTARLTLESKKSVETVTEEIKTALERYLADLCSTWTQNDGIVVRLSRIALVILDIDGVLDAQEITLNGASANISLGTEELPQLKSFTAV